MASFLCLCAADDTFCPVLVRDGGEGGCEAESEREERLKGGGANYRVVCRLG